MKLKYEFEIVTIDGESVAVPVGDAADALHCMVKLNATAAVIMEALKEETTPEQIEEILLKKYGADRDLIHTAVQNFLGELRKLGYLEETK